MAAFVVGIRCVIVSIIAIVGIIVGIGGIRALVFV